ncbi:hypothetical protein DERP_011610 [Dermatophagoides pteronyssinus]|uniref:Uncharacterized protein n=1 Tax=Dermatophagoides pteronyssinus TaxID=6956 RepID=A0ABQ8JXE0_DERPT|nr:hypothetical protein DERP_011610 [Dermatophagoides pteronyssinus]
MFYCIGGKNKRGRYLFGRGKYPIIGRLINGSLLARGITINGRLKPLERSLLCGCSSLISDLFDRCFGIRYNVVIT